MNNKIGFSTGATYSWDNSINNQIQILKRIDCNAIEISFGKISDLDEEIQEENIKYIRSLDYVSIHAPFFDDDRNDLYYENNELIKEVLTKLAAICTRIDVKSVVFHPNLIKDYSVLENMNFCICLENMPIERGFSIERLNDLMKKHLNYKLVLDTAHALSWDESSLSQLVVKFDNRISHIHFSDRRYSELKKRVYDHQQVLFCEQMHKFDSLKELDCPIIIEVSIKDKKNDINNLKEEFFTVEKFFSHI
ncbi:MAG: TIM barrel protein [archaeon]